MRLPVVHDKIVCMVKLPLFPDVTPGLVMCIKADRASIFNPTDVNRFDTKIYFWSLIVCFSLSRRQVIAPNVSDDKCSGSAEFRSLLRRIIRI